VLDKQNQKVHRLPLEPDTAPPAAQLAASDVEFEVAKAKRLARIQCPRCPRWQALIVP
jgi:hypothetical protein